VQVFQCNGGQNQRFNLESDGTFRSESGALCLDIPAFGRPPQNGDKLQVFHCGGGLNQQFDVQANGSVKSRATGGSASTFPTSDARRRTAIACRSSAAITVSTSSSISTVEHGEPAIVDTAEARRSA